MSVDTNTKGKNLAAYKKLRDTDDLQILVSPKLIGFGRISIDTKGFPKRVKAQIERDDDSCSI